MKSDFVHKIKSQLPAPSSQFFNLIGWATFIVYFITSFCGWFNFFLAKTLGKVYIPLKSYLITFNKSWLCNFQDSSNIFFNLSGYKVQINSPIPYKIIDDLFLTIISTVLILLFYIGYKIVQTNKINQFEIIKWSIVFSILMVIALPSHSSDIYGYIARGAQQTLYHQNPYFQTISEIKDYKNNSLFNNFMWPLQPATYGPAFIYLTKAIVFLSREHFFISFINFKLLNFTLLLLLILFTQRLGQAKDIYLISWNPLILIQGLWNCHNDLISGFLIFLGLFYLICKPKLENQFLFYSAMCLVLAASIKYISIIIIPLIVFYFLKNNPSKLIFLNLVLGLCCGLILVTIFSVDYLLPTNHNAFSNLNVSLNKIFSNISSVHKSLLDCMITLVKYFCRWLNILCDLKIAETLVKYIIYFAFGLFYLYILIKKKSDLIFDIVLVLLVFLGFTITKFHSWYLLNLVVLIPLLKDNLLKKILIALCMSHTYAITFIDQAKILNFLFMTLLPILFIIFKGKNKK